MTKTFALIYATAALALVSVESRLLAGPPCPGLQGVTAPADNPALPGGMDVFTPPVDGQTPVSTAPVFAEWSRFAGPDDTVPFTGDAFSVYSGADFGKDSRFIVYGQTSAGDATTTDGLVRVLKGNQAMITLDASLPDHSMYLVWAANNDGVSYPFALNRTEAWWLGPGKVAVGETVSFHGRNLSHDNGTTTSWIYLQPAGSAGQWITPTAVNPYKVSFTVPPLANGDYQIYVHNGHGGAYGWSKPLTLTVQNPVTWAGATIDVTSHGATGDGVTDDGAAIQAAIDASANGDTLYFPAGTYLVGGGRTLSLPANRRILGAGRTVSTIKVGLNNGNQLSAHFMATTGNTKLQSIGFDENSAMTGGYSSTYAVLNMTGDFKYLDDVLIQSNDNRPVTAGGSYMFVTRSRFNGTIMYLSSSNNVFIDDCDFYGMYDCEMVVDSWSGSRISLTNNTVQDYDPSNPGNMAGFAEGRFFRGTPPWATIQNIYIADNVTTDLTPRPGADQNSGEQILCEGEVHLFNGRVLEATGNTIRFANYTYGAVGTQARITITDGKGLGQTRTVSSYDPQTGFITIIGTWNVIPDSTSQAAMNYTAQRWAIYNNRFDAKDNAATSAGHIASTAVTMYQGSVDVVIDHNTSHQTRSGFVLDGASNPGDVFPTTFVQISNNTVQNNRTGIAIDSNDYTHLGLGEEMVGVVVRDNSITGVIDTAIENKRSSLMVIEHNSAVDTPRGLTTDASPTSLAYDNSFDRGTAALAGSVGVKFMAKRQGTLLAGNTYQGFALTYGGDYLPGPEMGVGYRCLKLAAAVGGKAQARLPVSNMGLGNLAWQLDNNSTWLTVLQSAGLNPADTIDDLIVVVDAQHLAPGTYTETLTFTGNGQTIRVTVEFTVGTSASYPHPVASNDAYVINQNTPFHANAQNGLLADDFDIAGHTLTAVKQSDPTHGSLSFNADGTFTYTPMAGYLGYDSFSYKAYDGTTYSEAKTVTLVVVNPLESLPMLSGLVTWLDAGKVAGYGDGETVKLWTDRSGNDKDATGNGIQSPSYQSNVINGQPVLRFSGDFLKVSNLMATQPATMFMVFSSAMNSGAFEWAVKNQVGSVGNAAIKQGGTTYISFPPVSGFHLKTYSLNGASSSVKTNGTVAGTGTMSEYTGIENLYLAARSTSMWQDMDYAEVILYDRVLTAAEENQVGYYLATKYGLGTPYTPVVTVEATDPKATEAGADAGQFRVSRGDALSGALTVNYTIGGTAAAGDYTPALAGSVVIPDGAAAAFININAVNDTDSEGHETLVLTLTSGTGYNIGAASVATVNIADDDRTVVQINATDPDAHETGPDSGQFTVDRNHNTGNLTVNYSISGTTTSADYSETLGGSVVIPDGSHTATITVTPVNDPDFETDETLILSLNATNDYQLGAATADTVAFHSEDLPVITISATDADASETGPDGGTFTVTRGGTGYGLAYGDLTVHYSVGGTTAAGDYTPALPGSVVIPNGQTSAVVVVTPVDDLLDESNETIVLTVVSGAGYTVGSPAAATVIIADDDVTPVKVWSGATDTAWATGSNWVGGSAPANSLTTDIANFNLPTYGGNPVFAPSIAAVGAPKINGIIIGGSNGAMAITTAGGVNRLQIGASGITVAAGAGAFTLGASTTQGALLGANQTWNNNSSSLMTIGSLGNNNVAAYTVTLAGSGTGGYRFNGGIGNGAGTTVEIDYTSGTVQLLGTNTFTGGLRIKGGQVIVGLDNALGVGTVTMGYGDGSSAVSIMNNASTKSYSAPIFLESTHSGTVTIGSTSGQATFTGGVTGTHDLIVDATANVIFSTAGLNHTGNLTKNGASILSLGAANTFGGIALVQAGTLRLDHVNALQNATLDTGTSGAQAVTFNLVGANTYNLGGLQGADALAIGSNTISVGANNASTTFSGAISGTGGGLTKVGNGTLTLSSATNGYTGATTVNAGTLLVNGNQSTASGDVTVDANATLGGIGTLGGNTTIANNGKLQFNLGTGAASHDALEITSGKALTFSGASTLTITSSGGASPGLYTLVTGGNNIVGSAPTLPNVTLPSGWTADAPVIVGNELRINITSTTIQTQYQFWAGGALFDADTNGDGVQNGLAFLLGASGPNVSALSLLPTVTQSSGNLILNFKCLNAAKRGSAVLKVQYSKDLGITDLWNSHLGDSAVVPGTAPTSVNVGGVDFVSSVFDADKNNMQATIPASAASPGTKLFGRLKAEQN